MSKGYDINRIAQLVQKNERIFHTKDLALLWKIKNSNTLHVTISRYCSKKILFRIYKGLYSLIPVSQLDPFLVGIKAIHQYAYVSTETILFQFGFFPQLAPYISLISPVSKKIRIEKWWFRSRKLKDEFLYNPEGIYEKDGVKFATLERAVADMLYFNPHYYIDSFQQLNWAKIKKLQKKLNYVSA